MYLIPVISILMFPSGGTSQTLKTLQIQVRDFPLHSLTFWSQRPSLPFSCFCSWSGSLIVNLRSATVSIITATWRPTSTAPISRTCETRQNGYWATSSPSTLLTSSRFFLVVEANIPDLIHLTKHLKTNKYNVFITSSL